MGDAAGHTILDDFKFNIIIKFDDTNITANLNDINNKSKYIFK